MFIRIMLIKKILFYLLVFISCTLLIAVLRWQSFSIPFDSDEGLYSYFGTRLFEPGFIPYRDAFEQKLPEIFFLYRLAFYAFGDNVFAIRMLSAINAFVAASLIFLLLRKIQKSYIWAFLLTILYVLFTNSWGLDALFAKPDAFFATTIILSLLLFVHFIEKRRLNLFHGLILGLLIGFSFLIKQSAGFDILIIPIWIYLYRRDNLKSFLPSYLLGAIMPVAIIAGIYWKLGLWFFFKESIIVFQSKYTMEGIGDILRQLFLKFDLFWLIRYTHFAGWLAYGAAILYWRYRKEQSKNLLSSLFLIGIIITLIQAKIQWREAGTYYFPLVAQVIAFYATFPKSKFTKYIILFTLILFVIGWGKFWLYEPKQAYIAYEGGSDTGLRRFYTVRNLGEEIKKRTNKNDKILSFTEEAEVFFYADRDSPVRFTQSVMSWSPYYKETMIKAFDDNVAVVLAYDYRIPEEIKKAMATKGYIREEVDGMVVYWRPK